MVHIPTFATGQARFDNTANVMSGGFPDTATLKKAEIKVIQQTSRPTDGTLVSLTINGQRWDLIGGENQQTQAYTISNDGCASTPVPVSNEKLMILKRKLGQNATKLEKKSQSFWVGLGDSFSTEHQPGQDRQNLTFKIQKAANNIGVLMQNNASAGSSKNTPNNSHLAQRDQ